MELTEFISRRSRESILPYKAELEALGLFPVDAASVEGAALRSGILPERYLRNLGSIGLSGQLRLHEARVAVIGCGGLGGQILEELGRLGVGCVVAVDPDRFEPSNLNRQLLATVENLGSAKAGAAARRLELVNPALRCLVREERLDSHNAASILAGCSAVADALDSIPSRLELAAACASLGIPLVHGSVSGRYGQVATQMPGGRGLAELYQSWGGEGGGEGGGEPQLGNPVFTPALVASLQVAELCRIIAGPGPALSGSFLSVDLDSFELRLFAI